MANYFKQKGRPVDYNDKELKALIGEDLFRVAKQYRLNGYEYIKAFHLEREPFTIENDLLTPTFKLKRHQARLYYAKEIEELYNEIERINATSERETMKSKL